VDQLFNPIPEHYRLSRFRPWMRVPAGSYAVVLEGRGGYRPHTAKTPARMADFLRDGYRHQYRVDLTPHEVTVLSYRLPTREQARWFRADLHVALQVVDPVKVVQERVFNAWEAVEPALRLPMRRISRRYGHGELAQVEEELHDYLSGRELDELGLRIVRAGVSLELEEPELKHEREKIDADHRRQLDRLHASHRADLEGAEALHQRQLTTERERHRLQLLAERAQHDQQLAVERAKHEQQLEAERSLHQRELEEAQDSHRRQLERARRELYEQAIEEGLRGLVLVKLAARPGGTDPKDIDQVIELWKEQRAADFEVPLKLLSEHQDIIQKYQLEEPVNALLRHLATIFGSPPAPPLEEELEVEVERAGTDGETAPGPDPETPPEAAQRPSGPPDDAGAG
jgi:hypothetical protein